jgi:hypothetical protein
MYLLTYNVSTALTLWSRNQGDKLPQNKTFSRRVMHSIPEKQKKWVCKEQLWVSDEARESHYRVSHQKNKGAYNIVRHS